MSDNVNQPDHYNKGPIGCMAIIEEMTLGYTGETAFCIGNITKYLYRAKDKNGLEDIRKAKWYLDYLVKRLEQNK